MSLTIDQQQLLHAWVDGETTDAESQLVAKLLRRPDTAEVAREYVAEIKRLRIMMAKHGGVAAPLGLRERVVAALEGETVRRNNILRLPQIAWRSLGLAAAAAVVVSIGLVYSGAFSPEVTTNPQTPVAQTPVSQTPVKEATEHWDTLPEPGVGVTPDSAVTRKTPPIVPPGDSRDGIPVLRLDRGKGTPFQLSVNMNRDEGVSATQVYNDMLIVSSFYGSAELTDNDEAAEKEPKHFTGRDLSQFEGLRIELDEDRLPELLAALGRLSNDQGYGEVIVPHDLQKHVDSTARVVEELQKLEERERSDNLPQPESVRGPGSPGGAWGYLPPETLGEQLRRTSANPADIASRIAELDEEARRERDIERASRDQVSSHKVSVLIQLR